jgi:hypothetical protein
VISGLGGLIAAAGGLFGRAAASGGALETVEGA